MKRRFRHLKAKPELQEMFDACEKLADSVYLRRIDRLNKTQQDVYNEIIDNQPELYHKSRQCKSPSSTSSSSLSDDMEIDEKLDTHIIIVMNLN